MTMMKRNGRYCTVVDPRNPTPVVLVMEVTSNADRCLGYRLQLCLRRNKLMILKPFLLTLTKHGLTKDSS